MIVIPHPVVIPIHPNMSLVKKSVKLIQRQNSSQLLDIKCVTQTMFPVPHITVGTNTRLTGDYL